MKPKSCWATDHMQARCKANGRGDILRMYCKECYEKGKKENIVSTTVVSVLEFLNFLIMLSW
jgi:hypothetical protein